MTVVTIDEPRRSRGPRDDRLVIRTGPDLHRVVEEAEAALDRAGDLFQRDSTLVHVVRVKEADEKREGLRAGTPTIRALPLPVFRAALTQIVNFQRFDSRAKEWVACQPPGAVAGALHAKGQWATVRPLVGTIETPLMRPDGSILQRAGYDAETGYLFLPGRQFPEVSPRPSQSDANSALAELAEVWCDFPWTTEAGRYVPIAAALTLIARTAICGAVPAFGFDAASPGTGKTLAASLVALVATGRDAPPMTWGPKEEENEKVLASYALKGAACILFDNLKVGVPFAGASLDRVLTARDRVELRILGKSEVPAHHWRSVICFTGNQLAVRGDTVRRVLIARLEADVERPQERTGFTHPDVFGWVKAERPRLVRAALTVLRAYVVAGRPDVGLPTYGSFEAWRDLVPAAIAYAGGPSVLDARAEGDDVLGDPRAAARGVIFTRWPELGAEGVTAKAAIEALFRRPSAQADLLASGSGSAAGLVELRQAVEELVPTKEGNPSAVRLGHVLRSMRGQVRGGRKLVCELDRKGIAVWKVVTL